MSKVMFIFGIIFLALGVALGLKIHLGPGEMQVLGLTAEVAAILLVGGALSLGFGGVIAALDDGNAATSASGAGRLQAGMGQPSTLKYEGPTKATAGTEATTPKPGTSDTLVELEKAKSDIAKALGVTPAMMVDAKPGGRAELLPAHGADDEGRRDPAGDLPDEAEESSLYVMEEKVIRGRPARVLSDGTVEAETDEGWMRFENLEHLNEYIDAMAPEA